MEPVAGCAVKSFGLRAGLRRGVLMRVMQETLPRHRRILVIKHSALGDFILAQGAFQAIREHHRGAHITLLTTAPFAAMAQASRLFDAIEIDPKPGALQWGKWLKLRRFIVGSGFERIYDLQHTDRTHAYFRFFGRNPPEWSGIAAGCSHPHANPQRNHMHTLERLAEQLADAGIAATPAPDLSWLTDDVAELQPQGPYALLVPGGAAHRPDKRWPAEHYAALAQALHKAGITPVAIGADAERAEITRIVAGAPGTVDLCGNTSLGAIAELARHARVAIGNDTGPMHIIAAVNCPSVVLFSAASVPEQTRPRGSSVRVLQEADLATLPVEKVSDSAEAIARAT